MTQGTKQRSTIQNIMLTCALGALGILFCAVGIKTYNHFYPEETPRIEVQFLLLAGAGCPSQDLSLDHRANIRQVFEVQAAQAGFKFVDKAPLLLATQIPCDIDRAELDSDMSGEWWLSFDEGTQTRAYTKLHFSSPSYIPDENAGNNFPRFNTFVADLFTRLRNQVK